MTTIDEETGLKINGIVALDPGKADQFRQSMKSISSSFVRAVSACRERRAAFGWIERCTRVRDELGPVATALTAMAELVASEDESLRQTAQSRISELATAVAELRDGAEQARRAVRLVVTATNATLSLLGPSTNRLVEQVIRLSAEAKQSVLEISKMTPPADPAALRGPATVFAARAVDLCRIISEHEPHFPDERDRLVLSRCRSVLVDNSPKLIAVAQQRLVLPDCAAVIAGELSEVARVFRPLACPSVEIANLPSEHELRLRELVDVAACHDQVNTTADAAYAVSELRALIDSSSPAMPKELSSRLRSRLADVLVGARALLFAPSDFGSSERILQLRSSVDVYLKLLRSSIPIETMASFFLTSDAPASADTVLTASTATVCQPDEIADDAGDVFSAAKGFMQSKGFAMLMADLTK